MRQAGAFVGMSRRPPLLGGVNTKKAPYFVNLACVMSVCFHGLIVVQKDDDVPLLSDVMWMLS